MVMKVIVKNNNVNKAFKLLSKKLKKENFFQEVRDNQFFVSKSEKKRLRNKQAKTRIQKEQKRRLEELEQQDSLHYKKIQKENKN